VWPVDEGFSILVRTHNRLLKCKLSSVRFASAIGPNAAICDFHNDGPTPCEEANRRIFIDSGFNELYFTFRLINYLMYYTCILIR
jgi:hypothetical protein